MPRHAESIFMGTTEVPVHRTIGEVQSALVRAGAKRISQNYNQTGDITGMVFSLELPGPKLVHFDLPVRTERIFQKLQSTRKKVNASAKTVDNETAHRVAWRQLLRWVEAQLAMVDTGMCQAHEVFMPYAIDGQGRTMFHLWSSQLSLPAPASEEKGPHK
jgi:hypothetical protein